MNTAYTLYGWTAHQWAIVLAAYPLESVSVEGALKSRASWKTDREYEPGTEKIGIPNRNEVAVQSLIEILPWHGEKVPPMSEPNRILVPR